MEPIQVFSTAAKPLELELSRYAARFARAVYIGDPPPFSDSSVMKSATVSALKFDDLFLAVICHHVLKRYRELKEDNRNLIFQIGRVQFNPIQHVISEDSERDLATLDLTPFVGSANGLEESSFIEPLSWPPSDVNENDVVCLAGFPGIWRDQLSVNELRFQWFSSGSAFVRSAREEQFVVSVRPEEPIVTVNKGLILGSLGGLSGGPVFCWRKTDSLLRAELVGFIYEYQEELDLMYVRAARVLNCDGTFA